MEINFIAMIVAAFVPMIIGFVWYNPKTLGGIWMKEAGVSEESMKGANMPLIFGLALFFSFMLSVMLNPIVIHQMGVSSSLFYAMNDPSRKEAAEAIIKMFTESGQYANEGRTFKHGAFHGILSGIFFAFPVMAINALFERKSFKYIFVNAGFWIICLAIMGGIISVWK